MIILHSSVPFPFNACIHTLVPDHSAITAPDGIIYLISILLAPFLSTFGTMTFSTPFSNLASTLS